MARKGRKSPASAGASMRLPQPLRESTEEQLAEAQRLAHLGSWEWDIVNDKIRWSEETYRIYGLEPGSMNVTYEVYQRLVHPQDRDLAASKVRSSLATGEPFDYDHRILRADGSVRVLNARGRVVRDAAGKPIRMFGTGQDITERRAIEIALRDAAEDIARREESEAAAAHLNRVFAEAPVVIAVLRGPDHVFETVNQKFMDVTGRRDVLGQKVRDAFVDLPATQLFDMLDKVYETGESYVGTGVSARLGDPLTDPGPYYNFVYQPLSDDDGVYGVLVVASEVTDQVTAQIAAEQARQDAELARLEALAASTAKSDFLATMSHELRTPLAAILGYGDLLAAEITGPINDDQRRQLSRIKSSANHLLSIIDEILTIARTDAGKERISRETVDVNELLETVGAMIEPLASAKGLAFKLSKLAEPLSLETDSMKLRQILLNLLSNAVNYTDDGEVSLTAEKLDGNLRVAVADTGVGVSPENVDKIFEPFWQVEQSTTRRVGGTGLGLSVTRQFVNLLGGHLTVESEVGRGSTFTVSLPAQGGSMVSAAGPTGEPSEHC